MNEIKNITKDFKLFATDKGVSPSVVESVINKANNSLTPVVLEERQMNVTAVDVFSRLLYDRQIFFGHEFNSETCNLAIAQLLYLDSIDNRDINIYINSPGGSVVDGLALIDTMGFINSQVSTLCVGEAASMGAVLLSCGEKGKRFTLPHGRVMIHQVSSGARGTLADMEIELEQTRRCKQDLYKILAENMGKSYEEIEALCDRNNWFIGQEAVDMGIVDGILNKKNNE